MIPANLKCYIIFLLVLFPLSGCGPRSLNVGAEKVGIYNSLPLSSCKFLGDIYNPSVHSNLDLSSSTEEIKKDDINFLKNEGVKLGANVVILLSHTSYQTQVKRYGKQITHKSRYFTVNEHSVSAKAYKCYNVNNNKSGIDIYQTPLIPKKVPRLNR